MRVAVHDANTHLILWLDVEVMSQQGHVGASSYRNKYRNNLNSLEDVEYNRCHLVPNDGANHSVHWKWSRRDRSEELGGNGPTEVCGRVTSPGSDRCGVNSDAARGTSLQPQAVNVRHVNDANAQTWSHVRFTAVWRFTGALNGVARLSRGAARHDKLCTPRQCLGSPGGLLTCVGKPLTSVGPLTVLNSTPLPNSNLCREVGAHTTHSGTNDLPQVPARFNPCMQVCSTHACYPDVGRRYSAIDAHVHTISVKE